MLNLIPKLGSAKTHSPSVVSRFLFVGVAVIFGATFAWAGNISSVRELPDETIKNVRHGRLSLTDITLFDVRIARETLEDVRARLGTAKSFRDPINSVSADNEICYSPDNATDETRVIFGAGSMGGWSRITQFQVLSHLSARLPCTPSARVTHTVSTRSGIRLGMSLNELDTKFGHPTQQGEGFVIYSFEQHRKRTHFDTLSGVIATLTDGRVTSFRVFLIESN